MVLNLQKQLVRILNEIPELNFLVNEFRSSDYRRLYTKVMTMPQAEVNRILTPLLDRIIPLYQEGKFERSEENFWAARAALTFNTPEKQIAVFFPYTFLISLK
jgi:mannose-6-phosphate isomerase